MSRYFHECPACGAIEPVRVFEIVNPLSGPASSCADCGLEGCRRCQPHDLCRPCEEERREADAEREYDAMREDYEDWQDEGWDDPDDDGEPTL